MKYRYLVVTEDGDVTGTNDRAIALQYEDDGLIIDADQGVEVRDGMDVPIEAAEDQSDNEVRGLDEDEAV